jgi:hypothetical protein
MDSELPDIDETGLRKVAQIERALKKLEWDNPGTFISITNALEFHLEIYPRNAETIRLLAAALQAFVRSRGVDPQALRVDKPFSYLLNYPG